MDTNGARVREVNFFLGGGHFMTTSNTRFLNFKADDFFIVCVLAIVHLLPSSSDDLLDKRFYNLAVPLTSACSTCQREKV
jgi:hypothetical protein